MKLYGLKSCDTCRKALKSLPGTDFFDVRTDGVPADLLARAFAQFEGDLLNTRSATWRALDESERTRPPLELLASHPTLMKRPLIVSDGEIHVGWNAETRAALGVD